MGVEPRSLAVCCSMGVGGPGAKIRSAKCAVQGLGWQLREGGRVGAIEDVEFVTHDLVREAGGAKTFDLWGVCVVVGEVEVRRKQPVA